MKEIKKIEELYKSSIALIEATNLEEIKREEKKDCIATVILTSREEKAYAMSAGNTMSQAALIASFLTENKTIMFATLTMLMNK